MFFFNLMTDPYAWLLAFLLIAIGFLLFPIVQIALPWSLIFLQELIGLPWNVKTGSEMLIGQSLTVIKPFAWNEKKQIYLGRVEFGIESWIAEMDSEVALQLKIGDQVKVVAVTGLALKVAPLGDYAT